ncbi:glutaredoxin 3 [Thiolapillus brandeum]|uniref:Glutaredoxin n=1 Tax=Thiolapillus brandeum TaxID=1076588 RepID=A0A7U6JIB4_9GAMM|nr:glutaredoxin 3 [Thiolapillus brandeum]BAO45354.1 glutaredoxin 3 [Thiolapillus brandeum]
MSSPRVVVYSTAMCPYCVRAKSLLQGKGVEYEEIRVDLDRDLMVEMMQRSNRRTVPQIFIDDLHVGGFDDMAQLDAYGKLDPLLGLAPHGEEPAFAHSPDASEDGPT